jgi:hypothetical protein
LKFFLDNNLPPNWAACLSGCSRSQFNAGHVSQISHLRDLFEPSTPDLEWLQKLALERGWTIISLDTFRKSAGAERRVIRENGLSVFVLQPSWASYPYWDKTAQLIRWWPRIVEQANSVEAIAMEVPWKLSGKFKQLQ